MKKTISGTFLALALLATPLSAAAQDGDAPISGKPAPAKPTNAKPDIGPMGPLKGAAYHADFVRLGTERFDGLLYAPNAASANSRIAIVFTFPRATFAATPAAELASRGYRTLWVTPYTEDESPLDGIAETSAGVKYMRAQPGVEKVIVMSHSGGGRMMAFYADLALNGPARCQDSRLIYPCDPKQAADLGKPDGVILLDPAPGAINTASAMDPAYRGKIRSNKALDVYAPANGFDAASGSARYSDGFRQRFYAAQGARNNATVDQALAQLKLLNEGKAAYKGDLPFVVPGAVNGGNAASLYHADMSIMAHTKAPHLLLKADGTDVMTVIPSVRAPTSGTNAEAVDTLCCATLNYTLKHYLMNDAIRVTGDYRITADDIIGVDWHSSLRSTPASAEGITVPTLILSMSCFHFVVPDEIIYDHIAAKDKSYASVEGAFHNFSACRPEYGDTTRRTFDFVANWLGKPGRF